MSSADQQLRVLAFESFDAGSHRAVREAITHHSRHDWTWVTRPGRSWKWRMRTAAIEMIDLAQQQGILTRPGSEEVRGNDDPESRYDAIFLTSLMSAADLRALLPSSLRRTAMAIYMHENQAAYPQGYETEQSAERDVHYPLTNLTSVLAADMVLWNSAWNRDSFLDGIEQILLHGSDLKIACVLHERVLAKCSVIWPPVEWPLEMLNVMSGQLPATASDGDSAKEVLHNAASGGAMPTRVVWPHRWEHDKGPEQLLAIARAQSESLNLRWTILGERYRTVPRAITTFQQEFADRIDHFGFEPDRAAYRQHLASCDWVLSTARHEFFGIAVVEAMLAGCLPWLPQRLSYTELLPPSARGLEPASPPAKPDAIRRAIRRHLLPAIAPNAVSRLDDAIESLVESLQPAR